MPTYNRLKLTFFAIFLLAAGGMLIYQIGWVWPGKRCEAAGKWWDPDSRICAQPILISDITGRTIQDKQDEAKAKAQMAAAEAERAAAAAAKTAPAKTPPAKP
jgi:hypothetical protein